MRTTQQFSITLPHDMAEAVESKIKSGAYASVSEVVRDGVRALLERDAAVERWLREEVVPGHQEYLRDPSKGVPADAILGRIKARRASRKKQLLCEGDLHAAGRAAHRQPT
jgi:antitoxin ParD1/3/4